MSRYQIHHDNVVADIIDGEVLAIRSDTGTYYSMRGAAAEIWAAVTTGSPVDAVAALIADSHPSDDRSVIAGDVTTFIDTLLSDGLIVELSGAEVEADAVAPPASIGTPWATPELERYNDMQDLLLFDPIHEVKPAGWPQVTER